MTLSELCIRRPVMTTLLTASIIAFGVFGFRLLPVSALPKVDFPTIAVTATLPGASADTGNRRKPNTPKAIIDAVISVVITGRRIQSSESVMRYAPALRARGSTRDPSDSNNCPSTTTLSSPDSPSEMTEIPWKVRSTLTGWTLATPSLTKKT